MLQEIIMFLGIRLELGAVKYDDVLRTFHLLLLKLLFGLVDDLGSNFLPQYSTQDGLLSPKSN